MAFWPDWHVIRVVCGPFLQGVDVKHMKTKHYMAVMAKLANELLMVITGSLYVPGYAKT